MPAAWLTAGPKGLHNDSFTFTSAPRPSRSFSSSSFRRPKEPRHSPVSASSAPASGPKLSAASDLSREEAHSCISAACSP